MPKSQKSFSESLSMVTVEGLSCGYGKEMVLRDVTLEVKRDQFLGLIGPNGSGKTTFIRAISGYLPPQKGTVLIDGKAPNMIRRKDLAAKVAVVTQLREAPPGFSVEEFVLLGRVCHWSRLQLLETQSDIRVAEKAMELTGTRNLRERDMEELSGGEKQLVCLARALAQGPDLLLLDEPTAHLDIGHQVQIMRLLKMLNKKGLTIVVVLHDLNLASLYCERLVLLSKGRIRKTGPAENVLTEEIINEVYETSIMVKEEPVTHRRFVFPVQ